MTHSILIAIGGGGATHGTHPELDDLCLRFLPKRPHIGYVGTASNDDPEKSRRFFNVFRSYGATLSDLPKNFSRQEAAEWMAGLDFIYVGGGNPVHLVNRWTTSGIHEEFVAALWRGVVIAGVSAGAMCWFDRFLWRSEDGDLRLACGLGIVPGVMTPHSLTEPDRLTHLNTLVACGHLPDAFAVDDGAALVLKDGAPSAVFPCGGPPLVHWIRRGHPGPPGQSAPTL